MLILLIGLGVVGGGFTALIYVFWGGEGLSGVKVTYIVFLTYVSYRQPY